MRESRRVALLSIALAASLLLVLALTAQKSELRTQLAESLEEADRPYAGLLVPTFEATTLAGNSATIGEAPANGQQVLFFFNTTCPYCRETLPEWNRLASELSEFRDGPLEVYGISLDPLNETREYTARHTLEFPVVTLPAEKLIELYRVQAFPVTMVLDESGRVTYVYRGSLVRSPTVGQEIFAAIGARDTRIRSSIMGSEEGG